MQIGKVDASATIDQKLMKLKQACRGFEAIMVEQMLNEMEKTVKDPLLKNNAPNDIYRYMYVDALSRKIAQDSPFGIGKLLFDSLKEYVEYKQKLPENLQLKPLKRDVDGIKLKKMDEKTRKLIDDAVKKASRKYGVPEKLIYGIIKAESDFNPAAVSTAGAIGLMQLMPETALEMGVKHLWDVKENILGGVRYLSSLIRRFKNYKLAIAAYNAGPAAVSRFNGIPPYKETQEYVKKVLAYVDGRY